ncbi:unnamed protein product, partial [Closterium sp. NIES-54]
MPLLPPPLFPLMPSRFRPWQFKYDRRSPFVRKFKTIVHPGEYDRRSPFVRKFKTIVHPGEVNRIRELVQNRNIIFTHTDSPDVLMWHVERHPFCTPSFNTPTSTPDLILVGHTEDAEFAMATSPVAPLVISGGKDHNVLLWNVADHVTSLQ